MVGLRCFFHAGGAPRARSLPIFTGHGSSGLTANDRDVSIAVHAARCSPVDACFMPQSPLLINAQTKQTPYITFGFDT